MAGWGQFKKIRPPPRGHQAAEEQDSNVRCLQWSLSVFRAYSGASLVSQAVMF